MHIQQLFAHNNTFYQPIILHAVTKASVGDRREGEVGLNKREGIWNALR